MNENTDCIGIKLIRCDLNLTTHSRYKVLQRTLQQITMIIYTEMRKKPQKTSSVCDTSKLYYSTFQSHIQNVPDHVGHLSGFDS